MLNWWHLRWWTTRRTRDQLARRRMWPCSIRRHAMPKAESESESCTECKRSIRRASRIVGGVSDSADRCTAILLRSQLVQHEIVTCNRECIIEKTRGLRSLHLARATLYNPAFMQRIQRYLNMCIKLTTYRDSIVVFLALIEHRMIAGRNHTRCWQSPERKLTGACRFKSVLLNDIEYSVIARKSARAPSTACFFTACTEFRLRLHCKRVKKDCGILRKLFNCPSAESAQSW